MFLMCLLQWCLFAPNPLPHKPQVKPSPVGSFIILSFMPKNYLMMKNNTIFKELGTWNRIIYTLENIFFDKLPLIFGICYDILEDVFWERQHSSLLCCTHGMKHFDYLCELFVCVFCMFSSTGILCHKSCIQMHHFYIV